VAFTGSVLTGRKISIAAAESNLKKVTLELGGKSPILVFDSADIEETATWTALAIWYNSGQDCCAGSRVSLAFSLFPRRRIWEWVTGRLCYFMDDLELFICQRVGLCAGG
jgi:aldehyde dehydrogenase (NAD+)